MMLPLKLKTAKNMADTGKIARFHHWKQKQEVTKY